MHQVNGSNNLYKDSMIFKNTKVINIPYATNPKVFYIEQKLEAQKKLNIKKNLNDKFIISFGATSAHSEKRKDLIKFTKQFKN